MSKICEGAVGQVIDGIHKNKGYEIIKVIEGAEVAKIKLFTNNSRRLCDYLYDAIVPITDLRR